MSALVFGDSQSQGIGREVGKLLTARGVPVSYKHKPGYSTAKLKTVAKASVSPGAHKVIYLFTGGNDYGPQPDRLKELVAHLRSGGAKVVVVGPPPATKITNLPLAKKVFGSKVKSATHWLDSGVAKRRAEVNEVYKQAMASEGVPYFDSHSYGIAPQADGIHVKGETARRLAHYIVSGKGGGGLALAAALAATVVVIIKNQ